MRTRHDRNTASTWPPDRAGALQSQQYLEYCGYPLSTNKLKTVPKDFTVELSVRSRNTPASCPAVVAFKSAESDADERGSRSKDATSGSTHYLVDYSAPTDYHRLTITMNGILKVGWGGDVFE